VHSISVRTKKSLFREQQGIACKRFKSLNELTPDSAEMTGNFANSRYFPCYQEIEN